jgi:23S rRNA A2030 N6-methylase RlmJ
MPYDHSRKIGNQGDLVKHPVLFACIESLLANWQSGKPFVYLETHAGRPEYLLPAGGEWQQGIGKFGVCEMASQDRRRRKNGNLSGLGYLGQFDEAFLGQDMKIGMRYPGSSAMAFRCLRAHNPTFAMRLYDIDQSVADSLKRYYHPWPQVAVFNEDGYAPLMASQDISFALIDPPSLDTDAVVALIGRLRQSQVSFLAWVPRTSRPAANKGEAATEAQTSLDFKSLAENAGAVVIGVQWYDWGHRFPGCWLSVSEGLSNVGSNVVGDLARVMGEAWRVE